MTDQVAKKCKEDTELLFNLFSSINDCNLKKEDEDME